MVAASVTIEQYKAALAAMEQCGFNQSKAANALGISRGGLRNRLSRGRSLYGQVEPAVSTDYDALLEYGSPSALQYEIVVALRNRDTCSAALSLGIALSQVEGELEELEKKAAKAGWAPNHWTGGVAAGYHMGKVTLQRNAVTDETERLWERQLPNGEIDEAIVPTGHLKGKVTVQRGPTGIERAWEQYKPEEVAREAALREAMEAFAETLPREQPIKCPAPGDEKLLNLYTLTDCHVGMMAWHQEGGANWDLKIAEDTLIGAFNRMVARSAPAKTAIVNQLGDFLHFDGFEAVTPTNKHLLDADGRFPKVSRVAVRILRRVINIALDRHEHVHVICAEGNHDPSSSNWLTILLAAVYEHEPRLTFEESPLPFYRYRHGNVLLGFHHGHTKNRESLPLMFAQLYRKEWGLTEHTYIHTGHRHHMDEKDSMGVRLQQHATLAARDAYAARHGYLAARQAVGITYHDQYGEWDRATVTPEMLDQEKL